MTPAAEPSVAEELPVLFPDIDCTVRDPDAGEPVKLVVKKYRFLEGLEMQVLARPLIAALADLIGEAGEGASVSAPDVDAVIGRHAGVWLTLLARATGRDEAWLARLDDLDGHHLNLAQWEVNGDFFTRRAASAAFRGSDLAHAFQSLASSMSSSAPGTAGDTGTSPNVSPSSRSSDSGESPRNGARLESTP